MAKVHLINGKIILKEEIIEGQLTIEDGKIALISRGESAHLINEGEEIIDLQGGYISPGWIDIHCHGAVGSDIMDADPAGVRKIACHKATQGVTGFIPTGMTNPSEEIEKAIQAVVAAMDNADGAQILGFHMEGPFLNIKRKGAHRDELIVPADADWTRKLQKMLPGKLIVTVAPEVPGNLEYIRQMSAEGVLVAIGHTDGTYDQIEAAYRAGATHGVHTFNGMRELHHREPGVVGAIMDLPLVAEIIFDGIHVHPVVGRILSKLKLPDKMVLVTDSMRAAGLEDGEYDLGGLIVHKRGKEARLADNTLAGSTLTMEEAVQNAVRLGGIALVDTIRMAATTPANLLGLGERKGSLEVGKDADLTLLTSDLQVRETIIGGKVIYQKG